MTDWHPNTGPQTTALQHTEFELLMGGSRGGSKTETGIVWMMKLINHSLFRGLVIRKNSDDLSDWVDRAHRMYSAYGAIVTGKPPLIRFPSGAKIRTGHLKDENAYTKYQGHEYHRIIIEELTQIPEEKYYLQLLASCRSSVPEIHPRVFLTTNPGGAGHAWVKERFIDISLPNVPYTYIYTLPDGRQLKRSRIFIPSRLEDTPQLMENDPNYVVTLEMLKDTDVELYKAWRLGDWNTFAGQFFREFKPEIHVMRSFPVDYADRDKMFIGGLDWGRTDPFSFHPSYVTRVYYTYPETNEIISFLRIVTYKEFYGTDQSPKEWGDKIKDGIPLKRFSWIQADNQIFNPQNDGSMSIFLQFAMYSDEEYRRLLKPASKERVGGWENMHNWLSIAPDGLPYWLITENCTNLIKSIPLLQHDEDIVEDVAASPFDHAPDGVRYMLKAIKWIDGRAGAINYKQRYVRSVPVTTPPMGVDADAFSKAAVRR